jgi:hypothetical protein|tara:strand:+ start:1218 stop:2333 length:1116 start_codon:yes stop_codon:yes gene_type:complete
MAQTIQIKRTTGTGKPTSVAQGELFYAYGDNGTYGKRLAIGNVSGGGNTPEIIGGKHFMDMLDHTAGNLTASSAIITDSNSQIDELQIKNQGRLKLLEQTANGSNTIDIRAPAAVTNDTILTLPDGAGSNGQALTTNGSGVLSWTTINSSFTLAADSGSNDTFNTGETLTFTGTANEIETTVSNNEITIGLPTNVTISGNLTVSGTTTTVSSTTVNVADSMLSLATGNNSSDAVDIGFYGLYDDSGSQDEYAGLFRDASDEKWKLFKNLTAEPTTTVNTSATGYAVATLVANLESSSVAITGGSITGITDLAVADGGTGLSAAAKGSVLVANSANTLSALDGGGSVDSMLLYTASSDTISWSNTIDGGTYS